MRKVLILARTSSILLLFGLPFFLYAPVKGTAGIKYVQVFWDSILHISILPIIVVTLTIALRIAIQQSKAKTNNNQLQTPDLTLPVYAPLAVHYATRQALVCLATRLKRRWSLPNAETAVIGIVAAITVAQAIQSQLQVVHPSWLWNPFLWGTYRVYDADGIPNSIKHLCLDPTESELEGHPLCLTRQDWDQLSSGMIDVNNKKDIDSVERGIAYARGCGGLAINIMSRDTVESIPALRFNVEGLLPFFPTLSVVVFENDSKDGSREAFSKWGIEAEGYDVDVMECEEAPGCKFNESHRYESTEATDYFKSSAIGPMAKYRQRMMKYILNSPKYANYSHVLVMDCDIGVSLSPLGVVHSLGLFHDKAIASASRQVWPGSFGTLIPPYDFAPFIAVRQNSNEKLFKLTQKFCEISEPGDRWRNQCESVSPLHLIMILSLDRSGSEAYRVESAFNGAALYPLKLVRERNATYDAGDDGQRCEHIGFNLSMKDAFFINPKWRMHLSPNHPGGPDGDIAMKNIARIVATPKISLTIFFGTLFSMIIVVYGVMSLSLVIHAVVTRFWKLHQVKSTKSN